MVKVYPFPERQNFRFVQSQSNYKINDKGCQNGETGPRLSGKYRWKRKQCWSPAFSPFLTMFLKVLSPMWHGLTTILFKKGQIKLYLNNMN